MIAIPKLILLALLAFAVWYAMRWLHGAPPKIVRRRQAPEPPPQAAVEDLTACRTCGAFVAAGARGCGKPGCPRPL
jgi:hypothetical protein